MPFHRAVGFLAENRPHLLQGLGVVGRSIGVQDVVRHGVLGHDLALVVRLAQIAPSRRERHPLHHGQRAFGKRSIIGHQPSEGEGFGVADLGAFVNKGRRSVPRPLQHSPPPRGIRFALDALFEQGNVFSGKEQARMHFSGQRLRGSTHRCVKSQQRRKGPRRSYAL